VYQVLSDSEFRDIIPFFDMLPHPKEHSLRVLRECAQFPEQNV